MKIFMPLRHHLAAGAVASLTLALALSAAAAELPTVTALAAPQAGTTGFDGVVEAVRQTVIAAQVAGAIVQIHVKAGDRSRPARCCCASTRAPPTRTPPPARRRCVAARAALDVARKDFERQQQLFGKRFISQAALERAESEFKATQAQVDAQLAQAGAARTQTGLHVVRAPYAGVVAEVPVALGDMAMPGRPLLTIYDPAALRVTRRRCRRAWPHAWLPASCRASSCRACRRQRATG